MNDWLVLAIAIIAHELGHYTHYRILGLKPKIEFTGYWIAVDPKTQNIFVIQALLNKVIAILLGFFFISYLGPIDPTFVFAYATACFFDMNGIYVMLDFVHKNHLKWFDKLSDVRIYVKGVELIQ
jgi:hypothetical protein